MTLAIFIWQAIIFISIFLSGRWRGWVCGFWVLWTVVQVFTLPLSIIQFITIFLAYSLSKSPDVTQPTVPATPIPTRQSVTNTQQTHSRGWGFGSILLIAFSFFWLHKIKSNEDALHDLQTRDVQEQQAGSVCLPFNLAGGNRVWSANSEFVLRKGKGSVYTSQVECEANFEAETGQSPKRRDVMPATAPPRQHDAAQRAAESAAAASDFVAPINYERFERCNQKYQAKISAIPEGAPLGDVARIDAEAKRVQAKCMSRH